MDMRNNKGQFMKGHHWRTPQPFWDKAWLQKHYVDQSMSTGEIASMFGVTDSAILFWLRKHGIERRTVAQARKIKHWGQTGSDNPMWNKRGELNPRWLGGVTPDRQSFYTSRAWKSACALVWKRDGATCRRCGLNKSESKDMPFHIHHIVSFADKNLRADPSNLVLLCETCHQFVHSKRNTKNEFLSKK
jgi:hypothetical protein